jgi:hypothetical protein
LTQRVTGWSEKVRKMGVGKMARIQTKYEHEGPCAIADEEVDNGGAAPAIAQSKEELDESEDKEDGFK